MSAETTAAEYDPYALSPEDVQEPPTSLWAALRKIGPGIVLAGSIVGSGELILTTALGAEFGFIFLWLILYSCVIKVFVQIELGRYAISSGLPTLAALNELPGPRFKTHWMVWWWFIMLLATVTQLGGMMGGISQAMQLAWPLDNHLPPAVVELIASPPPPPPPPAPAPSEASKTTASDSKGKPQPKKITLPPATRASIASKNIWSCVVALAVVALLMSGGYRMIERLTTVLVVGVTLFTVLGVVALQGTSFAIPLSALVVGLTFSVPQERSGITKAFECFGITGVGANELYYYPYWCIEKGYGRWTGPRTDDADWERRAKGWLRVLYLDAWVSMVVFTAATLSFFFLGAGVLHPMYVRKEIAVPEGAAMIKTLSEMYVPSFGEWTRPAFLIAAWAVLFKTLYVSAAGHSRLTSDFFSLAKFIRNDPETRRMWIRALCIFYPFLALVLNLNFPDPKGLMRFGAFVQAATLPVISGAAIYLRYKRLDPRLAPSKLSDAILIFAVVSITVVAVYAMQDSVRKALGL